MVATVITTLGDGEALRSCATLDHRCARQHSYLSSYAPRPRARFRRSPRSASTETRGTRRSK